MSYEKQTWQTGDVITASKLNHIENGIADSSQIEGGGSFIFSITPDGEDSYVADKSFSEIKHAIDSGLVPFVHLRQEFNRDVQDYLAQYVSNKHYYETVGNVDQEKEDIMFQLMKYNPGNVGDFMIVYITITSNLIDGEPQGDETIDIYIGARE